MYKDSLRFAKPHRLSLYRRSRGAAILMAILTVALIATVTSAIIAEHGAAIEQLGGRADQAQARWLARGAIDYSRNVLEYEKRLRGPIDHKHEEWAVPVPPLPIDEGELSGEIQDLSGRFNINTLINNGAVVLAQKEMFLRLLQHLDIAPNDAEFLTDAIIDWLDQDDFPQPKGAETSWYRSNEKVILPPQGALLSIRELLAVRGVTKELMARLYPHITALPLNATSINVNFASPELLAAACNWPLAQAQQSIVSRDQSRDSYFASIADFNGRLGGPPCSYNVDVQSYYFLATGRAHWGNATTHMEVLLSRPTNNPRPEIIRETIL